MVVILCACFLSDVLNLKNCEANEMSGKRTFSFWRFEPEKLNPIKCLAKGHFLSDVLLVFVSTTLLKVAKFQLFSLAPCCQILKGH